MFTPHIHHALAQPTTRERADEAFHLASHRAARRPSGTSPAQIVMRLSKPSDARALDVLAELDEDSPLTEPALVAEADGRMIVAIGLDSGRVLADPFSAVADVRALVQLRARQLMGRRSRRPRLATLRAWL